MALPKQYTITNVTQSTLGLHPYGVTLRPNESYTLPIERLTPEIVRAIEAGQLSIDYPLPEGFVYTIQNTFATDEADYVRQRDAKIVFSEGDKTVTSGQRVKVSIYVQDEDGIPNPFSNAPGVKVTIDNTGGGKGHIVDPDTGLDTTEALVVTFKTERDIPTPDFGIIRPGRLTLKKDLELYVEGDRGEYSTFGLDDTVFNTGLDVTDTIKLTIS